MKNNVYELHRKVNEELRSELLESLHRSLELTMILENSSLDRKTYRRMMKSIYDALWSCESLL